jgi:hypothetical protein
MPRRILQEGKGELQILRLRVGPAAKRQEMRMQPTFAQDDSKLGMFGRA